VGLAETYEMEINGEALVETSYRSAPLAVTPSIDGYFEDLRTWLRNERGMR
jgi:hypothetical protein